MATQQIVQFKKEYDEAKGFGETGKVFAKWAYISSKQDVLTQFGIGKGLREAGWSDVTGLAEFAMNPAEAIKGLVQLANSTEAREQFSESFLNDINAKIATVQKAIEVGGDENAEALGRTLGEIAWDFGSLATGFGGAAKGGVTLAKAGIKVGGAQLEKMAELARIEKVAANNAKNLNPMSAMTDSEAAVLVDRNVLEAGTKGLGQTGEAVNPDTTLDLFSATRGKDLSKLTNQQIGDLGEDISKVFLRDNNHTDIFAVQNRSGNGIDIVSRTPDGRLAFTEVKTSRTGM
ncbi:hypothetical protein PviCFBP13507_23935 [Pseudomonas viridiflava]|uniref:hypothetical protein n=3 Tax=Pseudomonas viridiflava TaxID=33069 RepID=UPI0010BF6C2A|nr:hypothetical protein [Pseudomonas viridiflava]TKJ57102.1 hypothetical protein PviCFBP13507_23935 [Pseudomonas viridiflava]